MFIQSIQIYAPGLFRRKGKVSKGNLGFLKLSLDLSYHMEKKNYVYNSSYDILQYSNIMGKSNPNKSVSSFPAI